MPRKDSEATREGECDLHGSGWGRGQHTHSRRNVRVNTIWYTSVERSVSVHQSEHFFCAELCLQRMWVDAVVAGSSGDSVGLDKRLSRDGVAVTLRVLPGSQWCILLHSFCLQGSTLLKFTTKSAISRHFVYLRGKEKRIDNRSIMVRRLILHFAPNIGSAAVVSWRQKVSTTIGALATFD